MTIIRLLFQLIGLAVVCCGLLLVHIGAALVWVVMTVWLLYRGVVGWPDVPRAVRLGLGQVLIGLAWWAMAQAMAQGGAVLLSVLCLVWMADSAAYFGGKAFGGGGGCGALLFQLVRETLLQGIEAFLQLTPLRHRGFYLILQNPHFGLRTVQCRLRGLQRLA